MRKSFCHLAKKTAYSKVLQEGTINPNLIKAEYAVRGYIPTLAGKLKEELAANPSAYKFKEIVELNIGNPLIFNTNPIWVLRELVAAQFDHGMFKKHIAESQNDSELFRLLKTEGVTKTEFNNFQLELRRRMELPNARNMGGFDGVKLEVARMIGNRDGIPANPDDIYLSNGASAAIRTILELIIDSENVGIMTPVPQYPLYSGLITLFNGRALPYTLNEKDNWQVEMGQLEKMYSESVEKGIIPRAIVLINPGNPTGNVFDIDKMEQILRFAHKRDILVLADEVYQENIYSDKPWSSFRKVLKEMDSSIAESLELVSFHSLSKGVLSECGLRGGYMELTNIDPEFKRAFQDFYSNNWANNVGQFMLMAKSMYLSGELAKLAPVALHTLLQKQYNELFESLKFRANYASTLLNKAKNMKCNAIEGAMYAFPQVMLPEKLITEANKAKVAPDVYYCRMVLERSGICLVPGSGFGQEQGTFHFRTTILPSPNQYFEQVFDLLKTCHEEIIDEFN